MSSISRVHVDCFISDLARTGEISGVKHGVGGDWSVGLVDAGGAAWHTIPRIKKYQEPYPLEIHLHN